MKKRRNLLVIQRPPHLFQFLLVMKLTIALLFFSCLQVSAEVLGQSRISIKLESVTLKKALSSIEKKSNFRFLYNEQLVNEAPRISLEANEEEVLSVVRRMLTNTGLSYQLMANNLVVLKTNENVLADIEVTGKVTNANGEPVVGATVTIKGTTTATQTNATGDFRITAPENATLVISYVGFETQEIAVNNRTSINVNLRAAASELQQVVVVGYGTQRKIDVTGSVAQIKGEEIAKQPAPNPISSLQGKVAGVQITNSGAPGASPDIRIRGVGTLYGSQTPLYVVDGVWYDDISFLNPGDIENINILKDASSESIYGVRAANGVVLITTKKGRRGKATVSYNGMVGYQHPTNQIKMANGAEYATLINELRGNTNLNPAQFGTGTDWYGQILRDALITNHQVSVSGGSERSTYNLSLGYFYQDGIVKDNNYDRFTARLQNDFQIFNPLKIGYTITGVASKSKDIPGGIFRELYTAAPIVPVYYQDGSYGDPSDFDLGDGANYNPQATMDFYNKRSKNYRITGSLFAEVSFAKHFVFKSSVGGDFGQAEYRDYTPEYVATLKQRNTISSLTMGRTETRNWILENTLTYKNTFGDHSVTALLGQSAQQVKFYKFTGSAKGVPYDSEADLFLRLGNSGTTVATDEGDLEHFASYFARVNYAYRGKYLLNASLRADGASKFSSDKLWGYFPSVGVGWIITDEDFMRDQDFFNTLKLRGSWGIVGNAKVPSNLAIQTVNNSPNYAVQFGPTIYTGANITTLVPPVTNWEKAEGIDVGIEGAILNRRLNFEFDYYNRKTIDAIFAIPILGSIGTTGAGIVGNQATIQNSGFEMVLSWRDKVNEKFSYTISGNLGINNNKVTKTQTGENPVYGGGGAATGGQLATRTIVGQPIGQFYGLQVASVFQDAAEVAASAQPNAKPGDFRFVDQNKDNIIDAKDRIILGNPNAKYSYGINTFWQYGNFDLAVDFQGVAGVDVYNALLGIRYGTENFSKDFYDNRWHGAGTSNAYPSANIGGGDNYKPSSFYVEDGSYFRIRNIQLGYTFGGLQKAGITQLRVYVNAQNSVTFFKYRGFSPEIGGGALDRGIDTNVYPLYATYNFGVNLTF